MNPYGELQTLAVGGRIDTGKDWLELFRAEGFEPPNLSGWEA
jgi:hypothetical protein